MSAAEASSSTFAMPCSDTLASKSTKAILRSLRRARTESVRGFCERLLNGPPADHNTIGECCLRVNAFLEKTTDFALQESSGAITRDALRDALEKLALTQLHGSLFGIGSRDAERDAALGDRLQQLQHIRPIALGVRHPLSEEPTDAWAEPIELIRSLPAHRAPRDKAMLLVNASRLIERRMSFVARREGLAPDTQGGADDFFPLFVYVVLRANPVRAASEVTYMARFRSQAALRGVQGYCFTSFRAAVDFLERFDATRPESEQRETQRLVLQRVSEILHCTDHPLAAPAPAPAASGPVLNTERK